MQKDADRSVPPRGLVDVKLLDLRWAVGKALGFETGAYRLAPRRAPFADLLLVRCPDTLVVGVIKLLLVHLEPDTRSLHPWCLLGGLLRQRRARHNCCSGGASRFEHRPPRHTAFRQRLFLTHRKPLLKIDFVHRPGLM